MTKKAKDVVVDGDVIASMIKKQYGIEDVYIPAASVATEDQQVIPLSPKLNIITSGGVPEGTWMVLGGKPKSGKTTLALYFASQCQKPEYGEREVYYLDIERRLKKMNLVGTPGLNLDKFHVIRSTKNKILSAQDFLGIAEYILRNVERALVIVDSYSALCHESEMSADIGTPVLGMGSYTLLAQFCRQMSQVVPVMKSNVLGITHVMANIGAIGHAKKTVEKGGNAIVYQGDVKLFAKTHSPWKVGAKQTQIGQSVTWLCEFSALGQPGMEVESYIRYGIGIDELYEYISCAIDFGLIKETTPWFEFNEQRFHGKEELYNTIKGSPELQQELQNKVKEVLKQ